MFISNMLCLHVLLLLIGLSTTVIWWWWGWHMYEDPVCHEKLTTIEGWVLCIQGGLERNFEWQGRFFGLWYSLGVSSHRMSLEMTSTQAKAHNIDFLFDYSWIQTPYWCQWSITVNTLQVYTYHMSKCVWISESFW